MPSEALVYKEQDERKRKTKVETDYIERYIGKYKNRRSRSPRRRYNRRDSR
jgi:hypothetical protein